MFRLLASVAFAFLLFAGTSGVQAAGKAKPAAAAASTTKTCKFKLSTGKVQTWTCDKSQICCASEQFGLYTCGSQLLQCF